MLCPAPITLDPEVPFVDHLRVSVDGEFFAGTVGVESMTAGCVGGRTESSDAAPGEASAGAASAGAAVRLIFCAFWVRLGARVSVDEELLFFRAGDGEGGFT